MNTFASFVAQSLRSAAGALALTTLLAASVAAHTPERAANLLGHVLDEMTGRPIVGASVELESMSTNRLTSALGSFAFTDVPLGVHFLRIEAVGYAERRLQVRLSSDESYETEIHLSQQAIELEGLDVTVIPRKTFNEMRDLDLRLERGTGQFLLRTEMQQRGGNLINLLQGLRGVRVQGGGGTTSGRSVQLRRAAHITSTAPGVNAVAGCFPAIFVDGRRFSRRASLGDEATDLTEFQGSDLEAVEVYSGSSVPAIFGGGDAACGAILIWMRRGPARRDPGNDLPNEKTQAERQARALELSQAGPQVQRRISQPSGPLTTEHP